MSHRSRIVKTLRELPRLRGRVAGLPRTVLEGLARTPAEKRAAPELVEYLIASGDLVKHGDRGRGVIYSLRRRG